MKNLPFVEKKGSRLPGSNDSIGRLLDFTLDRIFGIGNVEIETAGFPGPNQQGSEEKLEGILFYEEIRDFVLRHPYGTATEIIPGVEEPVPMMPDSLDDGILITLREIRDILKGDRTKVED